MRRLVLAFAVMASACHRDAPQTTNAEASVADASIPDASIEAAAVVADASPVDAPSKPPFRSFDPASSFLHRARNAGGLTMNDTRPEPLTPEQSKKADDIARTLSESDQPPAAIAALRDDLAAGLRKGRFDDAKLRAGREAVARGMEPLFAVEVKALNDLHALLTPAQREYATVSALIGRVMGGNVGHVTTDRCRAWTKDLPLDAKKKKQIDATLPSPQALVVSFDQRMASVARAFGKDPFDARTLEELDPKKKAVLPLDVETEFLRKVAPLLDEESRKVVAERFGKEDAASFRD